MSEPGAQYVISAHAVARFRERVRPALARRAAKDALKHLLELGDHVDVPPPWLASRAQTAADAYIVAADVVFPLARQDAEGLVWLVKTCLTRGGISDLTRVRRNERRRRQASRASNSN